jgi:pimeloyl-ACP methyl ester carboxylesterase
MGGVFTSPDARETPMYDLSSRRGDGSTDIAAVSRLPKPSLLLAACEIGRVSVEYPSSLLVDALVPASDEGQGRPVLVLPGFYSPDGATRRCRSHLRRLGYQPHGWGLGRNYGLTDDILDGVLDRFDELDARHGEPLSVVGWSFGGLLARWVAHQRPDRVRQVVCLGSPYRREGEHTRTTPLFERTARTHGLSDRALEVVETLRQPLPVPVTAIYSKTDGIVNWRGCALDAEDGENIAVPSSHVGLVSNPVALAVLADRLAQDPPDPRPFDWGTCLRRAFLGQSGHRRTAAVA